MKKPKLNFFLIYFFLLLFLISVIYTIHQFKFLSTSFKIYSSGNIGKITLSKFFQSSIESHIIDKNTYLQNKIIKDSGYTLSFQLKTSTSSAMFFYTSDSSNCGSVFWNIYIIDGKIETARLNSIPPVIVEKKVNDNVWHHIIISAKQEQKIFIDGKLESETVFGNLYVPDEWFNFNLEGGQETTQQIYLKDVLFINRLINPKEIDDYNNIFDNKNCFILFAKVAQSFMLAFLFSFFSVLLLALIINRKYPNQSISTVLNRLYPILFIIVLYELSLWTGYRNKILILSVFLILYYLNSSYKNLFPEYIRLFFITPIEFFIELSKLTFSEDIKGAYTHLFKNKPLVYYLLLIFLALLWIF